MELLIALGLVQVALLAAIVTLLRDISTARHSHERLRKCEPPYAPWPHKNPIFKGGRIEIDG